MPVHVGIACMRFIHYRFIQIAVTRSPPTHRHLPASCRHGGKPLHIRRVRSCVFAIDQVDNHLNHDLPLIRLALGNQQGKCDQRIIDDAFFAVGVIQEILAL